MTVHPVARTSVSFRVISVVLLVLVWTLTAVLSNLTYEAWYGDLDAMKAICIGYGLSLVYFFVTQTAILIKALRS